MYSKSILLIDDEQDYCFELKKALDKAGFETSAANSINQALIEISKRKFDLLLIDKMLKDDFDGIRLAETLSTIRPEIKAVLMSGFLSQETRINARTSIAYGFIEKPFRVSKLVSLLENALSHKSNRDWADSYNIAFARIDNKTLNPINLSANILLNQELFEGNCSNINYLFSNKRLSLINLARKHWVTIDNKFHIATRKLENNCDLLCILPNDCSSLINHPKIELIYGTRTLHPISTEAIQYLKPFDNACVKKWHA